MFTDNKNLVSNHDNWLTPQSTTCTFIIANRNVSVECSLNVISDYHIRKMIKMTEREMRLN